MSLSQSDRSAPRRHPRQRRHLPETPILTRTTRLALPPRSLWQTFVCLLPSREPRLPLLLPRLTRTPPPLAVYSCQTSSWPTLLFIPHLPTLPFNQMNSHVPFTLPHMAVYVCLCADFSVLASDRLWRICNPAENSLGGVFIQGTFISHLDSFFLFF